MHVAVHTEFAASRKEPLADVVERIHAAIVGAGLGEPFVRFAMADSPVPGGVSSLDRVLKRCSRLDRFGHDMPLPGSIEFWRDRPHRPHDRMLFVREGERWLKQRLFP